jgi:hypothetical protein
VDGRLSIFLCVGALPGAWLGERLMRLLEARLDRASLEVAGCAAFAVLFVYIIASMWRGEAGEGTETTAAQGGAPRGWLRAWRLRPRCVFRRCGAELVSVWAPLGIGLSAGLLTCLLGIGGGILVVPMLFRGLGAPIHVATGTSAVQIAVASGSGAFHYFLSERISFGLVGLLLLGSVPGGQAGAWLAKRLAGPKLQRYFVSIVALALALVLYKIGRGLLAGPSAAP